ncbi:MAG: type II/IV secretion system ATPase subunit [Desulfurococcus sp.]|nr:type II/IV secretion system ATPase subunit [Desulfurococcus sp.]
MSSEATGDNSILAEYTVGGYRVRVRRSSEGYLYEAVLLINQDLVKRVEERLEDLILVMRKGVDPGDAVSTVLGLERSSVPQVLYLLRVLLGFKELQVLLEDPLIEDVSISGVGPVWVRHKLVCSDPRVDFIKTNIVVDSMEELVELQQQIALRCGTYISTSHPIIDAQLPLEDGGHRVHMVSPTVAQSRPEIVVRKKPSKPPSIKKLVGEGVLPESIAEYIRILMGRGFSLIIAGPPGSGKTTLLRSILYSYIPRDWKIVVIEDTGEIDPPPDSAWARYVSVEIGALRVSLFDLAKAALRSSASRLIVVGETRGEEARVLVQAMLAGMAGLTTFHGSSPEEVIARLTSPPISLTPQQVSMFTAIAFMGFSSKPRRVLKRISELRLNRDGSVGYVDVWVRERDGVSVKLEELLERSVRLHGVS